MSIAGIDFWDGFPNDDSAIEAQARFQHYAESICRLVEAGVIDPVAAGTLLAPAWEYPVIQSTGKAVSAAALAKSLRSNIYEDAFDLMHDWDELRQIVNAGLF